MSHYRKPYFKNPLDGKWYIRPYDAYQAPIFKAPTPGWNAIVANANIVASWVVPRWLQRRLDCRAGAVEYWTKVRQQEQRDASMIDASSPPE